MILKILTAGFLLGSSLQAADDGVRGVFQDRNLGGWNAGENVMSRDRTDRCEASANAMYDALEMAQLTVIDTTGCIAEIRSWLESLKATPNYRNNSLYRLDLRGRNKVDDALTGLNNICGNAMGGYWSNDFRGLIKGRQYSLADVLAMVWTVYNNFEIFYARSDLNAATEKENLKLTILSNMASFLEDDGHMVCDTGVSSRIINMLQGYIDGVNITADVDVYAANQNADTGIAEVTPLQYIDYSRTKFQGLMANVKLLGEFLLVFEFPAQSTKDSVLAKMRDIKQSWVHAYNAKYPNGTAGLPALNKIFDDIITPMEAARINSTITDFPAYNADDFKCLYYSDTDTQSARPAAPQAASSAAASAPNISTSAYVPLSSAAPRPMLNQRQYLGGYGGSSISSAAQPSSSSSYVTSSSTAAQTISSTTSWYQSLLAQADALISQREALNSITSSSSSASSSSAAPRPSSSTTSNRYSPAQRAAPAPQAATNNTLPVIGEIRDGRRWTGKRWANI